MVNERLEMIKKRLSAYYKAELAVLSGQEYKIGTRSLRRADLAEIQAAITRLERQVAYLEGGSHIRARRIVLRDI